MQLTTNAAEAYRPQIRETRYLNQIAAGQPVSLKHALFLPTTLEAVRVLIHAPETRPLLVADLKLLTHEDPAKLERYIDWLLQLFERIPYSMVEQIQQGDLIRAIVELNHEAYWGITLSPQKAVEALFHMEVAVSDHGRPFDELCWGLDFLQKSDYLPEQPGVVLSEHNGGHALLIHLLEQLADACLINQNGSHHGGRLDLLANWPGCTMVVLEEDAFGPLRCGLTTTKGIVCYG